MASGGKVELEVVATGGDEAAEEIKKPVEAAKEIGPAVEESAQKSEGGWAKLQAGAVAVGNLIAKVVEKVVQLGAQLAGRFLDETSQAEAAQAKLEAVLRSTGAAAGITAEQANALAAELAKLTGVDDDLIVSAEAVLLRFRGMSDEVFPRATKAALDLSAGEKDAAGAALVLGKALSDPVAGLDALSRSGIRFRDEQKEQIKLLAESGRLFEAQKIILSEVERAVGGAAEAFRGTLGGALQAADNAAGDLLAKIGEGGLSGSLNRVADDLAKTAQAAGGFAEKFGKGLGAVVESLYVGVKAFGVFKDSVGAGLGLIIAALGAVGQGVSRVSDLFARLTPDALGGKNLEEWSAAARKAAEDATAFGVALAEGSWESAKTGADGVAESWGQLIKGLEEAPAKIEPVVKALGPGDEGLGGVTGELKTKLDALLASLDPNIAAADKYAESMKLLDAGFAAGAISSEKYAELARKLKAEFEAATGTADDLATSLDKVVTYTERAAAAEKELQAARDRQNTTSKQKEDIEKRLAELAEKPGLSFEESEEQIRLESELVQVRAQATQQAREAAAEEANLAALRKREADETNLAKLAAGDYAGILDDEWSNAVAKSIRAGTALADAVGDQAEGMEQAGEAADGAKVKLEKVGDQWRIVQEKTEQATAATAAAAEGATTLGEKSGEAATEAEKLAEAQGKVAKEGEDANKKLEEGAKNLGKSADEAARLNSELTITLDLLKLIAAEL